MVKCWALHLEIKMESYLVLMKEQNCNYQMYPLIVLIMASSRVCFLETPMKQMMELSLVFWVVLLMAIIIATLMVEHLVNHWDLLMDLFLTLMKASRLAPVIVKCWPFTWR